MRLATTAICLVLGVGTTLFAGCGGAAAPLGPEARDACSDAASPVGFSASDGWTFGHRLAIDADGTAELDYSLRFGPDMPRLTEGRTSFVLSEEAAGRIRSALEDALPTAGTDYVLVGSALDVPTYTLTACGHRVSVDARAIEEGEAPAPLGRVVRMLDAVVDDELANALAARRSA